MKETGCEVICGAPTTPAVKGQVKVKTKSQTNKKLREQLKTGKHNKITT